VILFVLLFKSFQILRSFNVLLLSLDQCFSTCGPWPTMSHDAVFEWSVELGQAYVRIYSYLNI